jgi:hypothetical protein
MRLGRNSRSSWIVFINRHGVAVCSVECHAHGIRQARLPRQKSKWQSSFSNATRMAFDKLDCHDRNQNGNRACRMPKLWHSRAQNARAVAFELVECHCMAFDKLDCHRIGHPEPQPATIVFAKHRSPFPALPKINVGRANLPAY